MPVSISDGNNHLSSLAYDASGNTTSDGAFAYTWNAESEVKTAAGVTYNYDADGRRGAKVSSKLYWYGSGSEILAETDAYGNTRNEYIFFGGKRVALLPNGSTAQYYVEDALGSSRVITTNTGVVCYDADFYPYGGDATIHVEDYGNLWDQLLPRNSTTASAALTGRRWRLWNRPYGVGTPRPLLTLEKGTRSEKHLCLIPEIVCVQRSSWTPSAPIALLVCAITVNRCTRLVRAQLPH